MPARKATQQDQALVARRLEVSRMYVSGFTQHEIGKRFGISQPQVSLDLATIRKEWVEQTISEFAERQALELAKIDNLERVAWEEWERSKQDVEVKTHRVESAPRIEAKPKKGEKVDVGAPATMVVLRAVEESRKQGRIGDERFLGTIRWCIETRLRMFNIIKPPTAQQTTNVMVLNWEDMLTRPAESSAEKVERMIENMENQPPKPLNGKSPLNGDGHG